MKLVIDEKIKHRLTGLVVIVSLAVIFLPVIMKSSNRRLDENIRVSLKLPHKPVMPDVAIPKQETMFGELNVAHVDLPTLPKAPNVKKIAKAEPLIEKTTTNIEEQPQVAAVSVSSSPKVIAMLDTKKTNPPKIIKPAVNAVVHVNRNPNPNPNPNPNLAYAVQLASFTKQNNAILLVNNLRKKGFIASSQKVNEKNGVYYKVLVGNAQQKNIAVKLQHQLASDLRMNGFIVKAAIG